MLKTQEIEYQDGKTRLKGYCAFDDTNKKNLPAVLIAPDYSGRGEFPCEKAKKLAELGYVGFAVDMYGDAKTAESKEEKKALMQPFVDDRHKLLKRITAAYETVKNINVVDTNRIGAIGFCFGGLCVLDLARSGADLKGVVSFHGGLKAPDGAKNENIKAKILVLHGFIDPMVPPEMIIAFGDEMTTAKADWEMDIYGNAMHAFTNPKANDPDFGTVYNLSADQRSWVAMRNFLHTVFV